MFEKSCHKNPRPGGVRDRVPLPHEHGAAPIWIWIYLRGPLKRLLVTRWLRLQPTHVSCRLVLVFLPCFLLPISLPNRQPRIPSTDPAGSSATISRGGTGVMGLFDSLLNWLRRFPSSSRPLTFLARSLAAPLLGWNLVWSSICAVVWVSVG
jgi:hypothetical protein